MRAIVLNIGICLILSLAAACGSSATPTPTAGSPSIETEGADATATAGSTPTTETATTPTPDDPYIAQREALVQRTIEARGVTDPVVLAAMRAVPRHRFVPDEYLDQAYADHPLPIGYGQTISQPYIVALMTEVLELEPGDRVLEIGTGSGYQAAVLAVVVDEVYTIEIVPELAESAAARLAALGYDNVVATQGDGYFGWEEFAPFDAIIVTAAPDHLPQPLVGQLKDGGRIVIPIGPPGGYQSLWRFTRAGEDLQAENLLGVRFVPLTGPGIEGGAP
jgi:protein-L-isoaspartate(D-aspartate) O-methyltransferase